MSENDLIQDRYRLQEPIGKGGMAEVWCARDERLERPVAVKFLAPQFHDDPEFLVRFFSEAQSVAQLTHPNVVQVLDFGDFEDRPYLVMEYVAGGALADLTGQPMLPERATEIVAEAARGAGAAHAIGLVHRDLKPANILLTREGSAKLADFGIASSATSEKLTATGQAIGSPHYISPEQAAGLGCGPPSDIYALGVVLYELLTGRPPFEADNVTAIAIAHVDRAPRSPSELVADIDPALEELVLRCLAKDPAERFEDGSALAAALEDPNEAPALFPLPSDLSEDGLEPAAPLAKRLLTGIGITAVVLGLLAAGVWAAGRPTADERERSYDQETVDRGAQPRRDRPQSSPSATFDSNDTTVVSGTQTPSPSPSEEDQEEESSQATERERERNGSSGAGGAPAPSPEPEESEEPSPAPTVEPTSEPSPAPTTDEQTAVTEPAG